MKGMCSTQNSFFIYRPWTWTKKQNGMGQAKKIMMRKLKLKKTEVERVWVRLILPHTLALITEGLHFLCHHYSKKHKSVSLTKCHDFHFEESTGLYHPSLLKDFLCQDLVLLKTRKKWSENVNTVTRNTFYLSYAKQISRHKQTCFQIKLNIVKTKSRGISYF